MGRDGGYAVVPARLPSPRPRLGSYGVRTDALGAGVHQPAGATQVFTIVPSPSMVLVIVSPVAR